ncbi:SDR family NAD(P)-dependent oxidoreductase [Streptantibioticus ferralitis]|uniref:SDR family NAD(P)-dependent oxidoreductase n=1 Tax=Streptantibioticus ferralitis TaxID=236510 RepID=A0ABT5YVG7_9ACTN|nr:SDR family NAD(P)-dependent oxidoreductase [Streptantibioticus ferralitis]MDF2255597.1 SDR family NAD(P)-dependent oxidoreductase [Streptantibioticus ferralitis]
MIQLDAQDEFVRRYGPWALIAGASEGTGAAYARLLAERGLNLLLLARRKEPLTSLATELVETYGVEVRTAGVDLTRDSLLDDLKPHVGDIEIGLLVYNAGASPHIGMFHDRPVEEASYLIDLNCRGPLLMAHHFGAAMAERARGGIILMTSTGSMAGCAYVGAYTASKSFVQTLGEALWIELGQRQVDVMVAMVGPTDTPAMRATEPRLDGLPVALMDPHQVATEAVAALGSGQPLVPVGPANRAAVQQAWPIPRADLVMGMSVGCAQMYDLPVPQQPQPRTT